MNGVTLKCIVGKGGVGKSYIASRLFDEMKKEKNVLLVQVDQQNNAEYFIKDDPRVIRIPENRLLEEIIELTPYAEFVDIIKDIAPDFKLILGLMQFLYEHKDENMTIIADFPPNCQTLSLLMLPEVSQSLLFKVIRTKEKISEFLKREQSQLLEKSKKLATLCEETTKILKDADWLIVSNPNELSIMESEKIEKFLTRFCEKSWNIHRILNRVWTSAQNLIGVRYMTKKIHESQEYIRLYRWERIYEEQMK